MSGEEERISSSAGSLTLVSAGIVTEAGAGEMEAERERVEATRGREARAGNSQGSVSLNQTTEIPRPELHYYAFLLLVREGELLQDFVSACLKPWLQTNICLKLHFCVHTFINTVKCCFRIRYNFIVNSTCPPTEIYCRFKQFYARILKNAT